jgi:WD40 repeat protein
LAARPFAPVAFEVIVEHDPAGQLEGRLRAEVDVSGLHLWQPRGRGYHVPRGAPVRQLGGPRLQVEIEGRPVDLSVLSKGSAARLTTQVVEFLQGKRSNVAASVKSAYPLMPLLLLPLGLPLLANWLGGMGQALLWFCFALLLMALTAGVLWLGTARRTTRAWWTLGLNAGSYALLLGLLWLQAGPSPLGVANHLWGITPRHDQGFMLQMPGVVDSRTFILPPFVPGQSFKIESSILLGGTYIVLCGNLTPHEDGAEATQRRAYQSLLDYCIRQFGPVRDSEHEVLAHGQRGGWNFASAQVRYHLVPQRAVVLIAQDANEADRQRFFSSLQLVGADWHIPAPAEDVLPQEPRSLAPGAKLLIGPKRDFLWAGYSSNGQLRALHARDGLVDLSHPPKPAWTRLPGPALAAASSPLATLVAVVGERFPVLLSNRGDLPPTKLGQPGQAIAVALSPDGSRVATGHREKGVHIWNAKTGECERVLQGLQGEVWSLAFSPDGKRLAAADTRRTICIYPLEGGDPIAIPEAHGPPRRVGQPTNLPEYHVRSLVFAPDSRRLLSVSNDHSACLWDSLSGKCIHKIDFVFAPTAAAFHPQGGLFAIGGADGIVHLYLTATGRPRGTLREQLDGNQRPGIIPHLAFHPEGDCLVVVTAQGVEHWNLEKIVRLTPAERTAPPPLPVPGTFPGRLVRLVGGSGRLAGLLEDGSIHALKTPSLLPSGEPIRRFGPMPVEMAVTPDGQKLLVTNGAQLNYHDLQTNALLQKHLDRAVGSQIALTPDGRFFASLGRNQVGIWDARQNAPLLRHSIDLPEAQDLAISPEGGLLAIAAKNSTYVHLFDSLSGTESARLVGHDKPPQAVAFCPNGDTLASIDSAGVVRLWDVPSLRERFVLRPDAPPANDNLGLCFSADGRTLACWAASSVWIDDVPSGHRLQTATFEGAVMGVAFDENCRVYIGLERGPVKQMDLDGPEGPRRPAAKRVDLSRKPPPQVPDLRPGFVEPHLALVADPASGTALAFTRDRLMLRLSYPELELRDAFWTGQLIYRAVLDAQHGQLIAAIATDDTIGTGEANFAGPLVRYDVRDLLAGKPVKPRLAAPQELGVNGRIGDLLQANDQVVYRRLDPPTPILGVLQRGSLKRGKELQVPFVPSGPLGLTSDGKTLILTGKSPVGEMGQLVRIDLATGKAAPVVDLGRPALGLSVHPGGAVVQTQFDPIRGSLIFLDPSGTELARWKSVAPFQRPLVAGNRLYMNRMFARFAPVGYDLKLPLPAEKPAEPDQATPWVGGRFTQEEASVLNEHFLILRSGEMYRLRGAGVLPQRPLPAPLRLPAGIRSLEPWPNVSPARITALVRGPSDEVLVGRANGRLEKQSGPRMEIRPLVDVGPFIQGLALSESRLALAADSELTGGLLPLSQRRTPLAEARPHGAESLAWLGPHRLAAASKTGWSLWNLERDAVQPAFSVEVPSGVSALAAARTGHVIVGATDGEVRIFSPEGKLERHCTGHNAEVRGVCLSSDAKRAYSADVEGKVICWDAATGQARHVISAHKHVIMCLALSRDEKCLATGALDGTVCLWNTETGAPLLTLPGRPQEPIGGLLFRGERELYIACGSHLRRYERD